MTFWLTSIYTLEAHLRNVKKDYRYLLRKEWIPSERFMVLRTEKADAYNTCPKCTCHFPPPDMCASFISYLCKLYHWWLKINKILSQLQTPSSAPLTITPGPVHFNLLSALSIHKHLSLAEGRNLSKHINSHKKLNPSTKKIH